MYEAFFSLHSRPFRAYAGPGGFVPVGDLESSLQQAAAALVEGTGVAVLTGPTGIGKTAFAHELAERVRERLMPVFVSCASIDSAASLWQTILFEMGQGYLGLSEDEARLRILETARAATPGLDGVLLMIDDAHTLSSEVLAQLAPLTTQLHEGRPIVRLLLSGQIELEEKLAAPAVEPLNQQIGGHFVLEPLSRTESAEFVSERLASAGGECEEIFEEEAFELICRIADGNPRCLNHLCDQSLLLACVDEERPVSTATVMAALDDLKGLPLHWNVPTRSPDALPDDGDDSDAVESTPDSNQPLPHEIGDAVPEKKDAWWTADDHAVVLEVGAAEEAGADEGESEEVDASCDVTRDHVTEQEAAACSPSSVDVLDSTDTTDRVAERADLADEGLYEEISVEDHYAALDRVAEQHLADGIAPVSAPNLDDREAGSVVPIAAGVEDNHAVVPEVETVSLQRGETGGSAGEEVSIEDQLAAELCDLRSEIQELTGNDQASCGTRISAVPRADEDHTEDAWDVIQPEYEDDAASPIPRAESCDSRAAADSLDDEAREELAPPNDAIPAPVPALSGDDRAFEQRRYERLFSRLRRRRQEFVLRSTGSRQI